MKKLLLAFTFLLGFVSAACAFPQGGITPCLISAQPGDLTTSAVSANVHLSTCGETLIIINNSAVDVRFRIGTTSATTALVTDLLIPKATQQTINVGTSGMWFAAVSASAGSLSFILGTTVQ